jgi:hypothetical protein
LFEALRKLFNDGTPVTFCGNYVIAEDPLVTDKERVQMMASEVWRVTGYRFTYVKGCVGCIAI